MQEMNKRKIRKIVVWLLTICVISGQMGNTLVPMAAQFVAAIDRVALDKGAYGPEDELIWDEEATIPNATTSDASLQIWHAYPDETAESGYRLGADPVKKTKVGEFVSGKMYTKENENWVVTKIEPETLELQEGMNEITIYYGDKAEVLAGLISTYDLSVDTRNTGLSEGEVRATKTAEWTDYENRKATITLNATGIASSQGVDVLLVLDQTGSMLELFGEKGESRKDALELYAHEFASNLMDGNEKADSKQKNRVGTLGFYSYFESEFTLYPYSVVEGIAFLDKYGSDKEEGRTVWKAIDGLIEETWKTNGGTKYAPALEKALSLIQNREQKDLWRPAFVVMMSDGAPSLGEDGPAKEKAKPLREAGYPLFTIGVGLKEDDGKILKEIASKDLDEEPYYWAANEPADLQKALRTIKENASWSASNAVITDIINTDIFELDMTSLPEGVKTETLADGNIKVIWTIGVVPKEGKHITLNLSMKPDKENTPGLYNTNTDVNLTYTGLDGSSETVKKENIGHPFLPVKGATITTRYYLVNKDGEYIDQSGKTIGDAGDEFRHLLFEEYITGNNTVTSKKGDVTTLLAVDDATMKKDYQYTLKQVYTNHGTNYKLFGEVETKKTYEVQDGRIYYKDFKMMVSTEPEQPTPEITITVPSASWVYDGQVHKQTEGVTVAGVPVGMSITYGKPTGSVKEVKEGIVKNTIDKESVIVKDANQLDITKDCSITIKAGDLQIKQRPITLSADSKEEIYKEGINLTAPGVMVTGGDGLVVGHTFTATATGSLSVVNEIGVPNPIDPTTVRIMNQGDDVTKNYVVTCVDGVLKLLAQGIEPPATPSRLTITSATDGWVYDGQPHSAPTYFLEGIKSGHTVTGILVTGQVKTVTSARVDNRIDYSRVRITDSNNNDVKSQYIIETIEGKLSIHPRPLILQAASKTDTYKPGKVLTAPEVFVVERLGLAQGHVLSARASGSLNRVNTTGIVNPIDRASVKITDETEDVTANYVIEYRDGLLILLKSGGSGGGDGGGITPTPPSNPETPTQPSRPETPVQPPETGGETPNVPVIPQPDGSTDIILPAIPPLSDVIIRNPETGEEVGRGVVDNDGKINVILPPGEYVLTVIGVDGVPMAEMPFTIPEGDVPLGLLPKTGERYNLEILFACMAFISGAFCYRRKIRIQREKE